MRNVGHGLALFLVLTLSCRADLTLRYTVDAKAGTLASPALGRAFTIRIKGDKTLTKLGTVTAIIANSTSAMTLLNPTTKQYAQISMAEYIDGLRAKFPSAASALMKKLKFGIETSKTGQFDMIAGLRAEEHLTKMSVSADVPGMPEGPLVRLEMHTWLASPDELNGIPELRRYASSAQRALNVSAVEDGVERVFQQVPEASEKLRALTEEAARSAGSLTLRIQEAVYNLKGDPNAPVSALTIELAEISSDAIDDSVFAVPPDFQLVSAAEIFKPLTLASPAAPGPANLAPGGRVAAPSVIYKRDPEYSEEARRAKLSGSVTLKLIVDKAGMPRNIEVVQSLGMGLDEKAIEAVKQWRFKPGQKDGQPVNEIVRVQVNFRLLDRPPQQ